MQHLRDSHICVRARTLSTKHKHRAPEINTPRAQEPFRAIPAFEIIHEKVVAPFLALTAV